MEDKSRQARRIPMRKSKISLIPGLEEIQGVIFSISPKAGIIVLQNPGLKRMLSFGQAF